MKLLSISEIRLTDRQRKRMDARARSTLRQSIIERGLLHPIGVWTDPGEAGGAPTLVYGGRRLSVITDLAKDGIQIVFDARAVPLGQVPTVEFVATDIADVRSSELEENTEREELSWQDRVRALAEIQDLRRQKNPSQTVVDTAKELASQGGAGDAKSSRTLERVIGMASVIAPHLDNPEIQKAKSASDAFQIITRRQEQNATAELVRRRLRSTDYSADFQILHGDSLEEMKKLKAGSVHLVLTDPPYGVDAQADNFSRRQAISHNYSDRPVETLDLIQKFLIEAHRVAATKSNLFMFCDPEHFLYARAAAERSGWTPFRTPVVWNKLTPGIGPWQTEGFQRTYEFILFATKGPLGLYRPVKDVIDFPRVKKEERRHGAQKPTELLEFLIDIASLPGDLVLDPFAGSFSTLVAAKAKTRRAIGIEKDREFVDLGLATIFGPNTTDPGPPRPGVSPT